MKQAPSSDARNTSDPTTLHTLGDAFNAAGADFAQLVRARVRSSETWDMHQVNFRRWLSHESLQGGEIGIALLDEEMLSSLALRELRGRRTMSDGTIKPICNSTLSKRLSTMRLCCHAGKRRRWIARLPEFPVTPYRRRPGCTYLRSKDELALLCSSLIPDRADCTRSLLASPGSLKPLSWARKSSCPSAMVQAERSVPGDSPESPGTDDDLETRE